MATAKQFLVTKKHKVDRAGNREVVCYELLEPQRLRVWRGIHGTSAVCKDKVFGLEMIEKFETGAIKS